MPSSAASSGESVRIVTNGIGRRSAVSRNSSVAAGSPTMRTRGLRQEIPVERPRVRRTERTCGAHVRRIEPQNRLGAFAVGLVAGQRGEAQQRIGHQAVLGDRTVGQARGVRTLRRRRGGRRIRRRAPRSVRSRPPRYGARALKKTRLARRSRARRGALADTRRDRRADRVPRAFPAARARGTAARRRRPAARRRCRASAPPREQRVVVERARHQALRAGERAGPVRVRRAVDERRLARACVAASGSS